MIHLLRTLRSERRALAGLLARAEDVLQSHVPASDLEIWIRSHYGDAPNIPAEDPAKSDVVEEIIRRADKRRRMIIRMIDKFEPNPFVETTEGIERDESASALANDPLRAR